MNLSILAQNIKNEMEKQGLNIQDLRKKAGIGYATLYDLLHGKKENLNSKNLEKIANALNCNIDSLMGIETIEYTVTDLIETLEIILESDDLKLDEKLLDAEEKEELNDFFKTGIELIRKRRKRNLK